MLTYLQYLSGISRLALFIFVILCTINPFSSILVGLSHTSFDFGLVVLTLLTITPCVGLILFDLLVEIIRALRVISYYIHRKKTFENGYEDIGIITKIKRIEFTRRHTNKYRFLLVVDYNGKKVNSLFFYDQKDPVKYSIGENINIKIYKNHKYVMLKDDYSIHFHQETYKTT